MGNNLIILREGGCAGNDGNRERAQALRPLFLFPLPGIPRARLFFPPPAPELPTFGQSSTKEASAGERAAATSKIQVAWFEEPRRTLQGRQ